MAKHKRINEYKVYNELYLSKKAEEEGIVELSSGVLCRKLEEGRGSRCPKSGRHPSSQHTGV